MATITSAAATYEDMAPWYDRFTADHDYVRWTAELEALARRHGLVGHRLLDVACGTGKSFEPFLRQGYGVVACDLSPRMAAEARRKVGRRADVRVADMRELPVLGVFDLVTCLGDAVNYLLDPTDLSVAFAGAARNLRAGGLYLFDVNTLATYDNVFGRDRCIDDDELFFAWRGGRCECVSGGLFEATVESFGRAHERYWQRRTSHHVQRHHPAPVIYEALHAVGFGAAWAYGLTSEGVVDGAPDEDRRTKTVFVARRSSDPPTIGGR